MSAMLHVPPLTALADNGTQRPYFFLWHTHWGMMRPTFEAFAEMLGLC